MFIQDAIHNGTDDLIDAIVINATSCGANLGGTCGAGGGGTTTGGGAAFVPIRLVHP